jgi:hypothetical protein
MRIMLELDHPCIVACHGVFYERGMFKIVMEFCDVGSLLVCMRSAHAHASICARPVHAPVCALGAQDHTIARAHAAMQQTARAHTAMKTLHLSHALPNLAHLGHGVPAAMFYGPTDAGMHRVATGCDASWRPHYSAGSARRHDIPGVCIACVLCVWRVLRAYLSLSLSLSLSLCLM